MAVLSWFALRVIPRRFPVAPPSAAEPGTTVPSRPVLGLVATAAPMAFLWLLMPPGNPPQGPAMGEGDVVYLPMAVAATLAIVLLLFRRWSRSSALTDGHKIWAVGGALVGHTLFVVVMALLHPTDTLTTVVAVTTGPALIMATVVLLALLGRRVEARAAGQVATGRAANERTEERS